MLPHLRRSAAPPTTSRRDDAGPISGRRFEDTIAARHAARRAYFATLVLATCQDDCRMILRPAYRLLIIPTYLPGMKISADLSSPFTSSFAPPRAGPPRFRPFLLTPRVLNDYFARRAHAHTSGRARHHCLPRFRRRALPLRAACRRAEHYCCRRLSAPRSARRRATIPASPQAASARRLGRSLPFRVAGTGILHFQTCINTGF